MHEGHHNILDGTEKELQQHGHGHDHDQTHEQHSKKHPARIK